MSRLCIVLLSALCLLSRGSAAQEQHSGPEELRRLPGNPLAYWAMDARWLGDAAAEDPNRALLEASLRKLLANIITTQESAGLRVLAALLDPAVLRDHPYRLVLLGAEITSSDEPGPGVPVESVKLSAVLQVLSAEGHPGLEATIRGALGGAQPEAADIDWSSRENDFLVAVGLTAAEAAAAMPVEDASFLPYRERCEAIHPEGVTAFEAFVDLDRLRLAAPAEMGWGNLGELMHAWRLANARGVMLRGRITGEPDAGPRTIHLALAWASRADPPVRVRAAALTHPQWVDTLGPVPGGAEYSMVLTVPLPLLISGGVASYEALAPRESGFAAAKLRWARNYGPRLDRIVRELPPLIAMAGPGHAVQGPTLIIPKGRLDAVRDDVGAVMASLAPPITWDEQKQAWALDLGALGAARPLLFTIGRYGLIAGWRSEQVESRTTPMR